MMFSLIERLYIVKILKISRGLNPSFVLHIYKQSLLQYIELYRNSESMKEIRKSYSDLDFNNAVNSIYINNEYICAESQLLRLLQYGGPRIKALNLLSKAYIGMLGGQMYGR